MHDIRFKCGKCAACCCCAIPVVTHKDVSRLAKATGMAPVSFVKMYSPREISLDLDHEGWVKMSGGEHIMGLKQKRDCCVFLSGDDRCIAYKARPLTCRTYPFDIELDRRGRIIALGLQQKASYKDKSCVAAPRITHNNNRVIEYAKKEDREDRSYWEKCAQWNKSPRQKHTLKNFLTFMGL